MKYPSAAAGKMRAKNVFSILNFLRSRKLGIPITIGGKAIVSIKIKIILYDATIDGAGEVRIFWKIAMNLSKPIMAVIALGAFNAAYRNFMFAFIVCQDQDMWTMMVHIYQLMQRSCAGV